ncbi:probable E3 ubiquitin-protein ligase makorin-1 [Mytilus edulis]|uniref:probable E3 ubiquitin-protein ligase makorin-1 n=1 Tax=Mytilus edulis TaxID=6550 RepID=UPI0039F07B74
MAEGGQSSSPPPNWSSKILCRYFLHGVCRQGDGCPYSHDKSSKLSMVCTFYQKGQCTYGDGCRYDHVKLNPKISDSKGVHILPTVSSKSSPVSSNMVTLKKGGETTPKPTKSPMTPKPEDWVKAKEFVPGQRYTCSTVPASYAAAVEPTTESSSPCIVKGSKDLLCPFLAQGHCPYDEECEYLHGNICDMCGLAVLHPENKSQREEHQKECVKQHEQAMELSFAVARSKDKCCGICMEHILEKDNHQERRFGIMSNCNHIFCLPCIRKWRGAKQFDNQIVRACPECRVQSDFVTPSMYWVDTDEEKQKLISGYKKALGNKPCKYFKEGKGECPFYDKCFYRHAHPDGTIADPKPRPRRRRQDAEGALDIIERINLWDFLEERQNRVFLLDLEEELDNLILNLVLGGRDSDSDSDFDGFW